MTKLFLFFRSVSGYLCVLLWGEMRNFLSTHFLWRSFCFVLLDLCLNFAFLSKNFVGTFSFRSSHWRILCRLMCVVSFILLLLQIKSSRVEKLFWVWFHRMVCVCVRKVWIFFREYRCSIRLFVRSFVWYAYWQTDFISFWIGNVIYKAICFSAILNAATAANSSNSIQAHVVAAVHHFLSLVTIVSLQGTKVFLSKQIERFLEFFLLFFVELCIRFYISFAVKTSGFHFDLFLDVFGCHLNADHFSSFSHTQPHVHIVCECSSLYLCDFTLCLASFGIRLSILRIICDFLFKNRSGNKWGGVVDRCQCGKLKVWKIGKIFELWPSFVNNMVVPHLVRLYAFVCSLCSLCSGGCDFWNLLK